MIFNWYRFSELTTEQLYAILKVRLEVFVVEQNCYYLDTDDKDFATLHLLGTEADSIVAYLRLFPPTNEEHYVKFGRVLTTLPVRKNGYGKQLIKEMLNYCKLNYPDYPIKCSAQFYLVKFYEGFGFKSYGDTYDDAGVLHIDMKRE